MRNRKNLNSFLPYVNFDICKQNLLVHLSFRLYFFCLNFKEFGRESYDNAKPCRRNIILTFRIAETENDFEGSEMSDSN